MEIRRINKKKGDPTDVMLFLIMTFFLVVSLVVGIYVNSKIKNIIDNTALNESSAYSSINTSFERVQDFGIQRAFMFMLGILIIGIIVSSFLIRVHPVFIFLYIIMLLVAIFVGVYLANAYEKVVENPQLSELFTKYETLTWVMQHIAIILLAVGALSMIIIFGKIGDRFGFGTTSSGGGDI